MTYKDFTFFCSPALEGEIYSRKNEKKDRYLVKRNKKVKLKEYLKRKLVSNA